MLNFSSELLQFCLALELVCSIELLNNYSTVEIKKIESQGECGKKNGESNKMFLKTQRRVENRRNSPLKIQYQKE